VQPADSFNKDFKGTYVVTKSALKLRTDAETKNRIIASMPKGAKVQCYGYYSKAPNGGNWLFVVYDGLEGFASKQYLKLEV